MLGPDFEKSIEEAVHRLNFIEAILASLFYHALMIVVITLSISGALLLDGVYLPSVLVNISAGALVFWLLPMVLDLDIQYGWKSRLTLLLIAAALAALAARFVGNVQSLLITHAVAFLLLVLLELIVRKWLHERIERAERARDNLPEFRD